ncbi:hypothetical protein M5X16_25545 [Paenibacillus chitinolyticus]|uniref:Uncharacterized protein n=1 Tax=Paenibacillus chitinolyticus TaxID=79263 RepID=A0ABT4FKS1_9BACL|nr:hypothetical protein [Paenibacillus chitinolyticus]MCY9599127.1 hypothetical protein [Paenibacillus chitinolyticus]
MSIRRLGDMRIKPGASGDVQPSDVRAGKTFSSEIDTDLVGTLPDRGAMTFTPSGTSTVSIPDGIHASSKITQVNVPADKVLTGTTIASVAGTMSNRGAPTFNVSPNNQLISPGYYSGGIVAGDANIKPENIRQDVWIGGVKGTGLKYGVGEWIPFPSSKPYRLLQKFTYTIPFTDGAKNGQINIAGRKGSFLAWYYYWWSNPNYTTNYRSFIVCLNENGTERWKNSLGTNAPSHSGVYVSKDGLYGFLTKVDQISGESSTYYNLTVIKYRMSDGAVIWQAPTNYISFSPTGFFEDTNGELFIYGSYLGSGDGSNTIVRYNMASGTSSGFISGGSGRTESIAITPDGRYIYVKSTGYSDYNKLQGTGTTSNNEFGKRLFSTYGNYYFSRTNKILYVPSTGKLIAIGDSNAVIGSGPLPSGLNGTEITMMLEMNPDTYYPTEGFYRGLPGGYWAGYATLDDTGYALCGLSSSKGVYLLDGNTKTTPMLIPNSFFTSGYAPSMASWDGSNYLACADSGYNSATVYYLNAYYI